MDKLIRLIAIGLIYACLQQTKPMEAQGGEGWSEPVLLSESAEGNKTPTMLTGNSERVYAAWIRNTPNEEGDTVSSISLVVGESGNWSAPLDVLAPQRNRGLSDLKIAASQDRLYLLWQHQEVYISSAPIGDPLNGQQWSEPVEVIAPAGSDLGIPDLAVDRDGGLHVSYPDEREVYYTRSTDRGRTWSTPVVAGQIAPEDQIAFGSRIAVDADGRIYIGWNTLQRPSGWPPMGSYVASSQDGGATFRQTQLGYDEHSYVSLVTAPGEVAHAVWNAAVGLGGRYHSISHDGGLTWSEADRFTELSGSTQLFVMLFFDDWGTLHLGTIADGEVEGVRHGQSVFYMTWDDGWSEPEVVASLPTADAHMIAMTVSEGNRIHVVWQQGDGAIWYSTKTSSMPSVPLRPLPTPAPLSADSAPEAPALSPTQGPAQTSEDGRTEFSTEAPAGLSAGLAQPLVIAAAAVLVLIGVTIAVRRRR
jgi:hypothetical protein